MQIKEIKIYNYGKLQNKDISFGSGINLIYGENEAGKSTMQAFMKSMLFGLEKTKGRAASGDLYTRYEPWHAPSYYSGAMRFEVEGKPFYLERNFYVKEKQERLCNEIDGEELSIAYGDLSVLLGGMTRAGYENTYEIPQNGATTGTQMAEILAEYLSDAARSGAGATHVTRALASLAAKKKEFSAILRQEDTAKKQKTEHLQIERELLLEEYERQKYLAEMTRQQEQRNRQKMEQIQEQKLRLEAQKAERIKLEQQEKHTQSMEGLKAFYDKIPAQVLRIGGAALAILNSLAYQMWYQLTPLFWLLEICFIGMFFLGIIKGTEAVEQQDTVEEPDVEEADTLEAVLQQPGQVLQQLEDQLREKEVRLSNLEEQLEQLQQINAKEYETQENMAAIELAMEQIERLSKELCEDIRDELDAEVSKYVSQITTGKYDQIRVDDAGKLQIYSEGRFVAPEQLSRGTLEQMFLALRLAVGGILSREEKMPLMLDETFAMYDDKRMEEALRMLAKMENQIFLFSCQQREEESLQKMGIPYRKVVL